MIWCTNQPNIHMLTWCTNQPNIHIHTFCSAFFTVSILKVKNSLVGPEFPMDLKSFFFPMENIFFPNSLYFWIFPNSLKSKEIGIFEVALIPYFLKLWRESFRHSMFVGERGHNLWLNCQFSRKINVHIYITILCQFKWRKYIYIHIDKNHYSTRTFRYLSF